MSPRLIQLIMPNAKHKLLPSERSPKARKSVADDLSKRFRIMIEDIPQRELTIEKYKEMVYSLVPSLSGMVDVLPLCESKALGSIKSNLTLHNYKNREYGLHRGYTVGFDLQYDKILSAKDTVVHETRHLFDFVCSPKYIRNPAAPYRLDEDMLNKLENLKRTVSVNNFLTPQNLKSELQNFDKDVRVDVLQGMRHDLEMERNAYKEELLFFMQRCKNPIDKLLVLTKLYFKQNPLMNTKNNVKILSKELKNILRSRHRT